LKYEIKQLNVLEIWSEAFNLYIDNFKPLILISIIANLPLLLLRHFQPTISVAETDGAAQVEPLQVLIWLMTLLVINSLTSALLIQFLSKRYLNAKHSVEQYINSIIPILLPIIGISVAVAVIVSIGFMALVIPGIYFTLGLSLAVEVMIIERLSIPESLTRSFLLTKGKKGEIFFYTLIFTILSLMAEKFLSFMIMAAASSQEVFNPQQVVLMLTQVLLTPLGACLFILIYFNIRVEKEAFSVDQLVKKN
jgi:hypothetical protein